jgi:tetratricopeptide (TPR) repeat protein
MELSWFLIIYTWLYFSIFLHEMGHFFAGKLVGFNPPMVQIGVGKRILNFNLFNSVIEFRIIPNGGKTYVYFLTSQWLRAKLIFFYLAGPIVHVFLFSVLKFIHIDLTFKIGYLSFREITFYLSWLELFLIFTNLFPIEYQKQPNDGKQVIDTLTQSNQQVIQKFLGLSRYQTKYDRDRIFFNNDLRTLNTIFEAKTKIDQRNFNQAIELLEPILHSPNFIMRDKIYLFDILASIVINHGEIKYLQKADEWSDQALSLDKDIKTLQGTRGAILIELGRYDEGKKMLLPLTERGNEPVDIAISCCYIAKADFYLGKEHSARNWLKLSEKVGGTNEILLRIQKEINCLI